MLSSVNSPIVRRVTAFLNAAFVFLALAGVFIGVNWDRMPSGLADFLTLRITVKNLLLSVICLTGGAAAFHVFGLTKPALNTPFSEELGRAIKACAVAGVIALLFPLTSHSGAFTEQVVKYFMPTAVLAGLCGRFLSRTCTQRLARTLNGRREIIVIGSGPRAARIFQQAQNSNVHILGFVDSPDAKTATNEVSRKIIGNLEELEGILMKQPVDEVLIALPAKSCYEQIQAVIKTCERAGVEVKYHSNIFDVSFATPKFDPDGIGSVVSVKVVHDDARLLVKRCIDIAGALVGLVVSGPLMLIIALAIRLTNPGPALFVQERYGWRKRLFRMYKFRTMVVDAEQLQESLESRNEFLGPAFKIRNDPRITPLGRFLRKTSLDELPQFLNVLRGEMSLVGPRPLPKRDVSRFEDAALMRRFSVKPGLTCLWQVNGRSNTDFEYWIEMDLRYIDTWSLSLDWAILAKTFSAVVAGRGAA